MFFKGLHKFDNRNLKAFNKSLLNKYLHLSNDKKFIEKVEIKKKKRKILSQEDGKKKKDNDNDDELDDNDDRIYRDQKNKIIPAFKTNRNGTLNELANHAYDLKKLWKKEDEVKEPEVEDCKDKDKREADSSLNKHYEQTESVVINEGRWGKEIDDDFAPLDEERWLLCSDKF